MRKIAIVIITFLIINQAHCQINQHDTSFFYSIVMIEKESIVKDVENSFFTGDYFDSLYIVNDLDTFHIKYEYPFIITNTSNLLTLKKLSNQKNNLVLYLNISRGEINKHIKMPFNIAFDRNMVVLAHKTRNSKFYDCYFSSVISKFNTSNKGYGTAIDLNKR